MELKYSQIAKISNFSNDKMVNLIKTKLAESENVAVALVFDDKLVVLDEDTDQFYSVDYTVEDKALKLENWEPIKITPDNDSRLEEVAEKYFNPFDEDAITIADLVESFKMKYADEPLRRMVNKASLEKKSISESNSKIRALNQLRQVRSSFMDDIEQIAEDQKISALRNYISEGSAVQNTISRINFNQPFSVSLFEETSNKVINLSEKKKSKKRSKNIKKKVLNMWTSESFKQDMKDMLEEMANAEEAVTVLEGFFDNHPELLVLKESELEDLILKTALAINEAKNSDTLVRLFTEYYNLDESQEARKDFIARNMINEAEGEGDAGDVDDMEFDADADDEDDSDKKEKKEKETTIDEDSINKILKVMNKIKGSLEEKTMEAKYVESFIKTLEDAKVGSISEGKLKEILDFLTSVYDDAKAKKEED